MWSLGRDVFAIERAADLRREAERERLIRIAEDRRPRRMRRRRATRSLKPSPASQPTRSWPVPPPDPPAAVPVSQGSDRP
jgi:hypothetical protein